MKIHGHNSCQLQNEVIRLLLVCKKLERVCKGEGKCVYRGERKYVDNTLKKVTTTGYCWVYPLVYKFTSV